jgi:protoporphyrinogen oxidase
MPSIAILGTGMAAFGAASRLAQTDMAFVCYDKNPHHGGHTATFSNPGGFLFDDGPHISFTKDPRLQQFLAAQIDDQYESVMVHINNYWHGYWITHPAQVNLYGLPTDLVVRILRDFVEAHGEDQREVKHYSDWLEVAYGLTFADTFPKVYGRKYHTTTTDNLSTEWLGPRMYRPNLEEVLRGALAPTPTTDVHYVTHFRYPTRGGFASYLRSFPDIAELRLRHEVVGLDPSRREIRFANGTVQPYRQVISSIPLPELVPRIKGVPADVLDAAGRLAFTTAVMVNLGVDREELSEAHITYVYDEDVIFPRLNFPHMLSSNNVPAGAGSIQVEVYFSDKYRPLDRPPETLIDPVIADLHKIGVLHDRDRILFREARVVPYANVIYDLERADALRLVHGFLDDIGVHYCGRYGDWNHEWTDEAFISGEQAALSVLDGKA